MKEKVYVLSNCYLQVNIYKFIQKRFSVDMFSTLNLYLECTINNSNDTINSFETISSVFIFSIYQYDIIKKSYYIDNYKCLHTSYLKYKLFRFKINNHQIHQLHGNKQYDKILCIQFNSTHFLMDYTIDLVDILQLISIYHTMHFLLSQLTSAIIKINTQRICKFEQSVANQLKQRSLRFVFLLGRANGMPPRSQTVQKFSYHLITPVTGEDFLLKGSFTAFCGDLHSCR